MRRSVIICIVGVMIFCAGCGNSADESTEAVNNGSIVDEQTIENIEQETAASTSQSTGTLHTGAGVARRMGINNTLYYPYYFSDGLAWVPVYHFDEDFELEYDEENNLLTNIYQYVCVDTSGNILFSLESNLQITVQPFSGEAAIISYNGYHADGWHQMINKSGDVLWEWSKGDGEGDVFDDIIAFGDGYFIAYRESKKEFDTSKPQVGVLNDKGEWVQPMSEDSPFAHCGHQVTYIGDGIFACYNDKIDTFYDVMSNTAFTSNNIIDDYGSEFKLIVDGKFENGKTLATISKYVRDGFNAGESNALIALNKDGTYSIISEMEDGDFDIGEYNDGVKFYKDGFYDINGNYFTANVGEYWDRKKSLPLYRNGFAAFYMEGDDSYTYYIVLDKEGNKITEIEQAGSEKSKQDTYGWTLDAVFALSTDMIRYPEGVVKDPSGNIIYQENELGIEYVYGEYTDGWLSVVMDDGTMNYLNTNQEFMFDDGIVNLNVH